MTERDFIKHLNALGLGSRLRRLSDRLNRGVEKIYRDLDLDFEPYWFPVFYLLVENDELPVTEIADSVKMTHPAVIHIIKELDRRKYIKTSSDQSDKRKRLISLSSKGRSVADQLKPVWKKIKKTSNILLHEADYDLLVLIDQIESLLDKTEYYERFQSF